MTDFFRGGEFSTYPLPARIVIILFQTSGRAIQEFLADECLQKASALAFATLLALVPTAAISFFFLTKLEAFREIEAKVRDFIFNNFIPARTEEIRRYLTEYTTNVGVLGIFGIFALILAAIFLFNTVEITFNNIWHVKKKRPFFSKLTSLWTVLTLTPILISVSFYLAAKFTARGAGIVPAWIIPYLLNILAFWFAYQFIPYTNVRVHGAVIAAVVAGVLWELAKGGFKWYINNLTSFSQIYGSLGTVPVFLLWLYLTWVIALFGTELAYAIQYPQTNKTLVSEYREFYAVRAMAEIAKMFGERPSDRKDTIDKLEEVNIPPGVIAEILSLLTEKNLLTLTEDKEYFPAKDPATISVLDIIEAVSGAQLLAPPIAKDPISRVLKKTFQEAGETINATLDGLNLQMLVAVSKERADEKEHPGKRRGESG